jgi:hypothetical protein
MVQLGKNSGQTVSMHTTARRWLLIFAVLGLVTSGTSTYVHYQLLHDRTYTSFCDVNSTVSWGASRPARSSLVCARDDPGWVDVGASRCPFGESR